MREDVPVGYTVGNVIGTESSSQSNRGNTIYTLNYVGPSFLSPSATTAAAAESDKVFDIDRRSGWLLVAKPLDREACAEYKLEVRAIDMSTSPQSSVIVIKVEVTDVNDNAPVWEQDPLVVHVAEDVEVGSAIWNFTASDADYGPNAELRYTLVNQQPPTTTTSSSSADSSVVFALDSLTGALIVAGSLDFESIPEYILVIRAIDQAPDQTDRLSASLTVRVFVVDVNDNQPVVRYPPAGGNGSSSSSSLSPPSVIYVSGNAAKGTLVSRIVADDLDTGDNARLTYAISGGNEHGYFAVAHDTGSVTVNKPFHKNTRSGSNFAINVTVSDHGSPTPLFTTISLNITLKTVSTESQLRFLQSVYHVNVSEDTPAGSVIISVSAHFNGHYYNNGIYAFILCYYY